MVAYIYLLRDPYTLFHVKRNLRTKIRYIGKTNNPEGRLRNHFSGNRTKRLQKWIQSLKKEGKRPRQEIIEECSEKDWHVREAFYIKKYLTLGHPLLNTRKGVKVRTDDQVRKKIKEELLKGEYFKLKGDNDRIVVKVTKGKYYLVHGKLIDSTLKTTSKYKAGSFYVFVEGKRYIVPAATVIYSTSRASLPEISRNI